MEQKVYRVALAGNPNVGKSTVFNALTGMHQHTGNWAGKTVACAQGAFVFHMKHFQLIDLPGTYSLRANSEEERVAQEALYSGQADAVIVVCDACCLERNLLLALQIMELCQHVLLCVNLMDEARERGIAVNLQQLSATLGIPAVGISARNGEMEPVLEALERVLHTPEAERRCVQYCEAIESRLQVLSNMLAEQPLPFPPRWAALRLLEQDEAIRVQIPLKQYPPHVLQHISELTENLEQLGWNSEKIRDSIIQSVVEESTRIAQDCVKIPTYSDARDRRWDQILLGKSGIPFMLLLLAGMLWLTMAGANVPSELLAKGLFRLGEWLRGGLEQFDPPEWLTGVLFDGIFRTLAWVISVMLPPMAIFFPLFTLLEDAGYLPRAAFLLDAPLRKSGACGKQALTMCMGLGCNACGVTGCRIIDSPRERLIAMLTNVCMPCNGRFPLLLSLTAMFLVTGSSIMQAGILVLVIVSGAGMTFLLSRLLSGTVLRGIPSAFTLELPPYRKPQFGQVLVRSLLDRTVFVLGRACAVAAPAGLLLWMMGNIPTGGTSLLTVCANALNPIGTVLGMDGMILLAFLLGFPANEIVIPILLMGYLSQGSLTELNDLNAVREIFLAHGWTTATAICTMTFSLFHFPCSTTVWTIWKESHSLKWTAVSVLLPTLTGMILCCLIHAASVLF